MAERIAILNVGGIVYTYSPTNEILREPANDFVKQFVGAERGLKRLALMKVSEIRVEEGPVVSAADPAAEALRVIEKFGLGWASVLEDGELLGWIDQDALEGKQSVSETSPRRFSAYVTERDSLRQALDSIVTSRTQVAVVVSRGQRYRGILSLERVSQEIVS
jgi:osmoprotectant transport system ATP-binding protein